MFSCTKHVWRPLEIRQTGFGCQAESASSCSLDQDWLCEAGSLLEVRASSLASLGCDTSDQAYVHPARNRKREFNLIWCYQSLSSIISYFLDSGSKGNEGQNQRTQWNMPQQLLSLLLLPVSHLLLTSSHCVCFPEGHCWQVPRFISGKRRRSDMFFGAGIILIGNQWAHEAFINNN